jgi:hypothetical protein
MSRDETLCASESVSVPIERPQGGVSHWMTLTVPPPWRHLENLEPLMTALAHPNGLRVLVSAMIEADGKPWLHVSFSRPDRLPSYDDLKLVKAEVVGADRKAIQVFPAESQFVNRHAYCLHLWSPLSHDPLPDFTRGNRMI